jgi:hypothetical protein
MPTLRCAVSAPLNIDGTEPTMKTDELWVCGHTRKCGWSGAHSELVQIPDKRMAHLAIKCTKGTCPKCGGDSFYVRKKPEPQAAA